MKKVIVWTALSILNIVVSYKAGEFIGEKLGESLCKLMIKSEV